jgi:hypothetical protein
MLFTLNFARTVIGLILVMAGYRRRRIHFTGSAAGSITFRSI